MRDKLWFYAGARRRAQRLDTLECFQPNGEVCYSLDRQIFNTQKISWQMTPSQRIVAFHTYTRRRGMGSGSRLVAWESRLGQTLPSHVGKVEWQAIRGNSMVINLMAGDMRWTSAFRGYAYGKVLKTDLVLGTTTGMSGTDGEDPIDYNHQARGSVSWYKPNVFYGSHDIKVGRRVHAPALGPLAHLAGGDVAGGTGDQLRRRAGQLRLRQLPAAVPQRRGQPLHRLQLSGGADRPRGLHQRLHPGFVEGRRPDPEPRRAFRARQRLRAGAMPRHRRCAQRRRQPGALLGQGADEGLQLLRAPPARCVRPHG